VDQGPSHPLETAAPPFERLRVGAFVAHASAQGPWSPGFCHGGGPAALIVHAASGLPTPTEMAIARVTVDLMRPVPTGELAVETRIARQGKKLQLIDVEIRAAGTLVVRGQVLRLRREEQPDATALPTADYAGPARGLPTQPPTGVGFSRLFEMRKIDGSFDTLGPGSVWFGLHGDLVANEPTSGAMRAIATADFANGVASVVPFDRWSYPNTDLTLALIREPIGRWILVDAECWAGGEGRGVTYARLGDEQGWFGRSMQTTIFERRG